MEQIVVLVLAALSGVAGFYELTEFNKTASDGKFPPVAAGVGGFVLGLFVAFLAPAIVLGVILGLVCYHEVLIFEHQSKDRLLGIPAAVWGGSAGATAFFGASLTQLFASFVVCVFAAFAGAFYLLYIEKERLQAENRMWISENQRLIVAGNARGGQAAASPRPAASSPPAAPSAPTAAPTPAALPLRPGAIRKPATWGTKPRGGATPAPSSGGDFLPHR